jgi:hypothetical protein
MAFAALPALAQGAMLVVSPTSGSAGTVFQFKGAGWLDCVDLSSGASVSVTMVTPRGVTAEIGPFQSNDLGELSFVWESSGMPVGEYAFSAKVENAAHQVCRSAEAYLTITSAPPPVVNILTVYPSEGTYKDTFTFHGVQFTANEQVSGWLTRPDDAVIGLGSVQANAKGEVVFGWVAEDATWGTWQMTMMGQSSGRQAVVSFKLCPSRPCPQPTGTSAGPSSLATPATTTYTGWVYTNQPGGPVSQGGAGAAVNSSTLTPATTLQIHLWGFDGSEPVLVWLTPTLGPPRSIGQGIAQSDGTLDMSWKPPAPSGASWITAYGVQSRKQAVVSVTVEP